MDITSMEPDELKAWAVATGNLPRWYDAPWVKRGARRALRFIADQPGFLAFCPSPPCGTLCIFATENDAKRARNSMEAAGVPTGQRISECYVPRDEAERMKAKTAKPGHTGHTKTKKWRNQK